MTLVEYAERELREAGLMDKDSDYAGMLGEGVLALVKVFAEQGHSGFSAHMAIKAFSRVAAFKPLNPINNPKLTGDYIEVHEGTLQSTRRFSLFSDDGGATWYDLDGKPQWWQRPLRWLRSRGVRVPSRLIRAYVEFPLKIA